MKYILCIAWDVCNILSPHESTVSISCSFNVKIRVAEVITGVSCGTPQELTLRLVVAAVASIAIG